MTTETYQAVVSRCQTCKGTVVFHILHDDFRNSDYAALGRMVADALEAGHTISLEPCSIEKPITIPTCTC